MSRFPFFTELLWYALDKYVWDLLGKTQLQVEEDVMVELYGERWERQEHQLSVGHQHITPQELFGLKAIVMFIHALPVTRKSVPSLLHDLIFGKLYFGFCDKTVQNCDKILYICTKLPLPCRLQMVPSPWA